MTYPKITDDSENMVGSGSSIAKSYQVGYQVAVRHWRSHSCLLKLKMAFARLGSVLRKPLFLDGIECELYISVGGSNKVRRP